jgi:hypothetical protein
MEEKARNPVILSIIQQCKDPLENLYHAIHFFFLFFGFELVPRQIYCLFPRPFPNTVITIKIPMLHDESVYYSFAQ